MKRKGDLFEQTRKKLTWQYSGVLIAFLSLFVILVYTVLDLFIWHDQQARLSDLADRELQAVQRWADQDSDPGRRPPRAVEDAFSTSGDQSFYYLIGRQGDLNLAGEIQSTLRAQVLKSIAEGQFQERQFDEATYQVAGLDTAPQREGIFLVTARELTVKQERVGTLYIGKEVTFQHELFRWLLVLLIGMSLLFFVLARWFSQLMSRRAIVPIAKAYARQREFVADASHELRTPLSVLLRSIEALQLQDSIEHDQFAQNVLSRMQGEVHSITKMTGDLLNLARSDAGEMMLERTLFNVRATADAVLMKLQPLAEAKGITLELQAPAELMANGDQEKVMQLLVLLVENAIKYTPESGAVQVRLWETEGKGGRVLALDVQDNGIGISPEVLPRIFDRFYREDKSRTRQVGGHGLGLAIAKNLVDACQGTIQVESEVGVGSTFEVRLPM